MSRIPIRARLSVLTALVGLVVVFAVGLVMYRHIERELSRSADRSLREEYGEMLPVIIDPQRSLSDLRLDGDDAGLEIVQVVDSRGRIEDATTGAGELDLAAPGVVGEGPVTVRLDGVDVPLRLLAAPVSIQGREQTIVVAASLEGTEAALAELRWRLLVVSGLAIVLLASISYAIVGLALRPVERMRAQAATMSPRHPGDRLALPRAHDELHRLAETFNRTIDDLESAVEERQAFIASASHELRTPLTNLRAGLELAQCGGRSVEELRQSIDEAAADTARLVSLTEGLLDLTLTRVHPESTRHDPMPVEPLFTRAVADVGRADVIIDVAGDPWVTGDADQLRRVIVNLVTNAFVHGRAPVTVAAIARGDQVEISVTDHGRGIPDSIRAQAFVAFVRADEAHQRPGAGLGLAIAAEIIEGHGGTIEHAHDSSGTHVIVCLPPTPPGRIPTVERAGSAH